MIPCVSLAVQSAYCKEFAKSCVDILNQLLRNNTGLSLHYVHQIQASMGFQMECL